MTFAYFSVKVLSVLTVSAGGVCAANKSQFLLSNLRSLVPLLLLPLLLFAAVFHFVGRFDNQEEDEGRN